jgi:hypothetical protein
MMRSVVLVLMSLALAVPAFGKSHNDTYPVPCSELWGAVKDTLSSPENYSIVATDDTKMTAMYDVHHAVHTSITGAALQRTNSVALTAQGTGCEMQVHSNYSGWNHDDAGDFKNRVNESLAKLKAAKPSESAKPPDATK